MDYTTFLQVLDSTIRLTTPLLLACLAGLYSERAGIFDIGLEGKILAAAFASAAFAYALDSAWLGLIAGLSTSLILSLIHGLASINFKGNQLISGVSINFLAAGLTVVVAQAWFDQGSRTPTLTDNGRFAALEIPFIDQISSFPLLGNFLLEVVSGHSLLVYIAFALVPITWWFLFRTTIGLHLRAVGENPSAVDTAGLSVTRTRYLAVIICGILCGLAGVYLSTSLQAGFTRDMSAGRGFIALAALIFAKWRPWHALFACLLFGFLQAISLRTDLLNTAFQFNVNAQLVDALPYIITVFILAGFVGRALPPKAGGEPYLKGR